MLFLEIEGLDHNVVYIVFPSLNSIISSPLHNNWWFDSLNGKTVCSCPHNYWHSSQPMFLFCWGHLSLGKLLNLVSVYCNWDDIDISQEAGTCMSNCTWKQVTLKWDSNLGVQMVLGFTRFKSCLTTGFSYHEITIEKLRVICVCPK